MTDQERELRNDAFDRLEALANYQRSLYLKAEYEYRRIAFKKFRESFILRHCFSRWDLRCFAHVSAYKNPVYKRFFKECESLVNLMRGLHRNEFKSLTRCGRNFEIVFWDNKRLVF